MFSSSFLKGLGFTSSMRLNPSVSRIKTQAKASYQILLGVGFSSLSPNLRPTLDMGQAGQGRPLGGPPSSSRRSRFLLFTQGLILQTSHQFDDGTRFQGFHQDSNRAHDQDLISDFVRPVAVLCALSTACYFPSPFVCTWTLLNLQSSVDLYPTDATIRHCLLPTVSFHIFPGLLILNYMFAHCGRSCFATPAGQCQTPGRMIFSTYLGPWRGPEQS